jgi:hypothetical protein
VLGDGHRRRRRRRRRVAHRGDRSDLVDTEVVDERAVGIDRLGAHAGGGARHVARRQPGQIRPGLGEVCAAHQRPAVLAHAGHPVLPCEPSEGRRAGQSRYLVPAHVGAPISLAGEREHRVGTEVGRAVNARRQVDAEERVPRVGHRVDEPPYPAGGVRPQPQVLAAERDDLGRGGVADGRGEQIRLQTGADDKPGESEGTAPGFNVHPIITAQPQCGHRRGGQYPAARGGHVGGERPCDGRVVDDGRRGGEQRGHPRHPGLQLAQLRAADPADPGHAVGGGAPLELAEPDLLGRVPRDHELAALVPDEAAIRAVGAQQVHAAPGHPGLGRARGIVDPGVHDPGVVPGLVRGDGRLLLEDNHVNACRRQTPGHREADDAGPDDADGLVRTVLRLGLHRHLSSRPKVVVAAVGAQRRVRSKSGRYRTDPSLRRYRPFPSQADGRDRVET